MPVYCVFFFFSWSELLHVEQLELSFSYQDVESFKICLVAWDIQ